MIFKWQNKHRPLHTSWNWLPFLSTKEPLNEKWEKKKNSSNCMSYFRQIFLHLIDFFTPQPQRTAFYELVYQKKEQQLEQVHNILKLIYEHGLLSGKFNYNFDFNVSFFAHIIFYNCLAMQNCILLVHCCTVSYRFSGLNTTQQRINRSIPHAWNNL